MRRHESRESTEQVTSPGPRGRGKRLVYNPSPQLRKLTACRYSLLHEVNLSRRHYIFALLWRTRNTPIHGFNLYNSLGDHHWLHLNTKTGPESSVATREFLTMREGVAFVMGARCVKKSWSPWLRSENDRRSALANIGAQSCAHITPYAFCSTKRRVIILSAEESHISTAHHQMVARCPQILRAPASLGATVHGDFISLLTLSILHKPMAPYSLLPLA